MSRPYANGGATVERTEVSILEAMQSKQVETRKPDWPAAAVAGFAAGAILMVLDLLWSIFTTGSGPWATSHKVAATVMGAHAPDASTFDAGVVGVALAAHYALGILSGLVLAAVSTPLRLDETAGKAMVTGALFGLGIYLINFHGFANMLPWFAEMRGVATLAAHLIFGVAIALLYRRLGRRG
jgi:hypothetical protein